MVVVMVVVVVVVVQVAVVVVVKSWPELVNNKLEAMASKNKFKPRAGRVNTNWGPGPRKGPGTGKYKHPFICTSDYVIE